MAAAVLVDFPGVQGSTEACYPCVPPLDEALTAHLLPQSSRWSPPLQRNWKTLKYLDKSFSNRCAAGRSRQQVEHAGRLADFTIARSPPTPNLSQTDCFGPLHWPNAQFDSGCYDCRRTSGVPSHSRLR